MEGTLANCESSKQQYDKLELKNRELERTLKAVRAGSEAGAQKVCSSLLLRSVLDVAFELWCKRKYRAGVYISLGFCIYKRFLSLLMSIARFARFHVLSNTMYLSFAISEAMC